MPIHIGCGGEIIARHPRWYDREDMVFDPVHYLPLLEKKITALDQAAPLAKWDLPPEFQTLRRLMEARMIKAGRREYVQVGVVCGWGRNTTVRQTAMPVRNYHVVPMGLHNPCRDEQ